ncbi:2-hydroxychromene-2-carboxylate isomerase [Meinhardsimonia xiamenensis]|jgi:2-hydroxychromene-2-carboxylate isomerase|uniref:2-hydroxychromene-2-carboxylate isomerase n=1 Tax=Meinhardsimonia xiamenensis TaxID=990712 RepID=A0A1G8YX36_9RHOB|nr:2-hydroxychromene-2-carboxylate isomerase [Meinhardsimonia xiamenensis]PRX37447.1 2-hydroxychromene-2-carboxylate isomerase [Meinhardsimonia xiamenensis]SDK06605.1 2-hydroxychromene-2-carboxylate isomerase [Meinhardsimonia xiamenensis]
MAHVDYFFSVISPFAYLAGTRLEEIAARHGATIRYVPVDIVALFQRTGGLLPAERHPARQAYRLQELRRQSEKLGLPINLQPAFVPTNQAPASYAIITAQKEGGGDLGALVHGLLRAAWAEDRNIAEDDVIRDCLAAAGFDPALADRGMLAGAEEYAANLEEAVNRGVFGSPFYLLGEEAFWGQDRLEDLERALARS